VEPSSAGTLAPSIRKAIAGIDRTQPTFGVMTLEQALADSIAPRRFNLLLLGNPVSLSQDFPSLPSFGLEMTQIERHFAANHRAVFTGQQATPAVYLSSDPAKLVVTTNRNGLEDAQFIPPQREKHRIASLALDEAAVARLGSLPALHRDPFDRMLICQAQAYGLTLAASDPLIRQYPVALL